MEKRTFLGFSITFLICLVTVQSSTQEPGWSYNKVIEPKCLKCACMGTGLSEAHRPTILNILKQKLYRPMSSRSHSIFGNMLMKGKVVGSSSEVDKLCFVGYYNLDSSVLTYGMGDGTNMTSRFSIKLLSRVSIYGYQQIIDPLDMPKGLRESYTYMGSPSHYSIIWTDGSSFLGTLCRFDGQTVWFVASIHKTLGKKHKKRILKKVAEQGFDPNMAHTVDYTNCD